MKRIVSISLTCPVIIFFACCASKAKFPTKEYLDQNIGDQSKFHSLIPPRMDDPATIHLRNSLLSDLSLKDLSQGFDGFCLRIWYSYSSNDSIQLTNIESKGGNWSADLYVLKFEMINEDSVLVRDLSSRREVPKSGWAFLWKKLNAYGVLTLPDFHEIPKYQMSMDGDFVTIEYASEKMYRIFGYQNPILFKGSIKEAKQIEEIIYLLESEFNFQRMREF